MLELMVLYIIWRLCLCEAAHAPVADEDEAAQAARLEALAAAVEAAKAQVHQETSKHGEFGLKEMPRCPLPQRLLTHCKS